MEWSFIVPLDELDLRALEQRLDHSRDVVHPGIEDVAVQEHDEFAVERFNPGTQRLSLAGGPL